MNFDTKAIKHSFSRAAPRYDAHAALQGHVRRHCVRLARLALPHRARVLDLGCGTGLLGGDVAETTSGWRLTGADLAPGMCAQAKKRMRWVVNADARALPFTRECFDGIVSSLMLQWIADTALAFAEMSRVVKPGGCAVIATFGARTLGELKAAFRALDGYPHVSGFPCLEALERAASEAGWAVDQSQAHKKTAHYPDTLSLMRSLQAIGASNRDSARKRGLTTPRALARLERYYRERFAAEQGIPATWEIYYLALRRHA